MNLRSLKDELVTDTVLALDAHRVIQSNNLTVGHDADSVGENVSLLNVLRREDNASLLSDLFDQFPNLAPRVNIKTTGGFIKDNNL